MQVELYYFDGCPNWTVADDRLRKALTSAGHTNVAVERHLIETPEEAERVGFTGSPTIRINGHDPFATGSEQVGLACRVYTTPDGLDGSPTIEQLNEVLS